MDLGVGTDAYTMRLFTLMATLPASLLSDVSDITKKGLYELAKPLEMLETYSPGDPIVRQVAERMRAFRDAVEPAMSDAMQLAFSIALKTNTLIPLEKRLGYSVAQSIVESAKALAQEIDTTETKKAIEDLMQKKAQPLPENLTLDDDPEIDRLKRRAAEMTKVLGKHYDWRELRDAETNKILDDADAKVLESKSKNIERYMVAYGQSIADQIVAGDSASEIMEATAKKAMANIISFIGDEAMAKGAMMAAEGNPMAIAMFAAGTAAYATAAYLGSTAKKSNATTSASSGSSAPSNSYYNLRVDATFADGESIARRFAQMQKAASQRGLIPQGAY